MSKDKSQPRLAFTVAPGHNSQNALSLVLTAAHFSAPELAMHFGRQIYLRVLVDTQRREIRGDLVLLLTSNLRVRGGLVVELLPGPAAGELELHNVDFLVIRHCPVTGVPVEIRLPRYEEVFAEDRPEPLAAAAPARKATPAPAKAPPPAADEEVAAPPPAAAKAAPKAAPKAAAPAKASLPQPPKKAPPPPPPAPDADENFGGDEAGTDFVYDPADQNGAAAAYADEEAELTEGGAVEEVVYEEDPPLETLDRRALMALARDYGAQVTSQMSNTEIIAAIRDKYEVLEEEEV